MDRNRHLESACHHPCPIIYIKVTWAAFETHWLLLATEKACRGVCLKLEGWVWNSGQKNLPSQPCKVDMASVNLRRKQWLLSNVPSPQNVPATFEEERKRQHPCCNRHKGCFFSFPPGKLTLKCQQGCCWVPHLCLIKLRQGIICCLKWRKREGNSLECWREKYTGLLQNILKAQEVDLGGCFS